MMLVETMREVLKAIKTEDLKTFIVRELKKACPNVAYQKATDKTPFPYIIFDFEDKKQELGHMVFIELNIYDKSRSTKDIETIADNIESILDDTFFNEQSFSISIDLNTRNNVEETDKSIQRRRMLFDSEVYFS